jgi:hypothetical protein
MPKRRQWEETDNMAFKENELRALPGYKCEGCGKLFRSEDNLLNHLRRCHHQAKQVGGGRSTGGKPERR